MKIYDKTTIIDGGKRIDGLVSIVMPSFNTAKYIERSIDSVIAQTYKNFELLIVDDHSEDNSVNIIKQYKDDRIKLFINTSNMGAAYSRNKALRESRGEWIAFLDSDDIWESEKLEKQINFMIAKKCVFSYTNYREFKYDIDDSVSIVTGPNEISKISMYKYCWPGCLTVMFNASKLGIVQASLINKNNDYAMWLCLSKNCNCLKLDEVLANYRKARPGSISTDKITKLIKSHYVLYRQSEGFGISLSIFCTVVNMIYGIVKKIFYKIRC